MIINELRIDEDEDVTSQNCTEGMCTYIHCPQNLTLPPDSVSVDIMGCSTESEYLIDVSTTNCKYIIPCSLGSHKMKGSAYSTLAVPTTAVPIQLILHSIFLVHLAELCISSKAMC